MRKSQRLTCYACGRAISRKSILISKKFDGFVCHFDSDDCLLIFRKLRAIYGRNFISESTP